MSEKRPVPTDGRRDLEGLLVDYRTYLSDCISRVSQFRAKHLGFLASR